MTGAGPQSPPWDRPESSSPPSDRPGAPSSVWGRPGRAAGQPAGPDIGELLVSFFSPEPPELLEPQTPPAQPEPPEPPQPQAVTEPLKPDPPEPPARRSGSAPPVQPDSSAPPVSATSLVTPVTWTVRVASDRAYYERMTVVRGGRDGLPIAFPERVAERRIPLTGKQMRIGRRSAARDLEPEIDLAGPPADPGISRLHAMLVAGPGGTWGVLDPGSANGTLLNGRGIAVGDLIPLRDGDRINLGAWTVITVHRGWERHADLNPSRIRRFPLAQSRPGMRAK